MPLTQVQRDLNRYAQEKLYRLILDVIQSFEIAGESKGNGAACLGSVMMRITATLAVNAGADRKRWLQMCNDVYEIAKEVKENEK